MKKLFVLTGAGMSVESGLSTFRDADGLWENYPVARVATHEAWLQDPVYVNNFYNMLRNDVTVVTQNVDNLHEATGSSRVIHLHGELMKTCSSRDVDNPRYWRTMTADDIDVAPGEKAGDGSLLRPYIVFFGEAVPNISVAADYARQADLFVRLPCGRPRAVRQAVSAGLPNRPKARNGSRTARRAPHNERRVGGHARAVGHTSRRRMTCGFSPTCNYL